ncbi:MAG: monofunctional biosynthetic peptidoglycan transglycosylase [Pseudomonadota bacterium]
MASTDKAKRGAGRKKSKRALQAVAAAVAGVIALSLIWPAAYGIVNPPGTFVMAGRALQGAEIRREWVRLEDISPHLLTSVIAAEDTRFCLHNGIDLEAIDKALDEAEQGRRLRGASTLSQQTAKNAFLWNGGGWFRKGAEAWMTSVMELFWSKRRVLEVYLNIAEWGDGIFGAEAAAKARFGKSARDLTPREAALLAAVLPNPHRWRVDPPGPYVRSRAALLERRMIQVRRDGLDACVRQ